MHVQDKELEILLVEDSEVDIMFMQEMMEKSSYDNRLHLAHDGIEALDFLKDSDQPLPHMILLDINMPRMNGKEMLKIIKSDEKFRSIPVIILTSSRSAKDVEECYNLQTNSYIPKPEAAADYDKLLRAIENFWVEIALIPGRVTF